MESEEAMPSRLELVHEGTLKVRIAGVEEVTLTEERVRFSLPAGVREIPLSAN